MFLDMIRIGRAGSRVGCSMCIGSGCRLMLGLSRPWWCNSTLLVKRKLMESPFWKEGWLKYVIISAESTKVSICVGTSVV